MEDDAMGDVQTGMALPDGQHERQHYEFEFEEIATSVEERFHRVYDPEKLRDAKVESQMEYREVSRGWWLVIKRMGLALWVSNEKPEINSGDLLRIKIAKKQ
jgi:hypothetical protein